MAMNFGTLDFAVAFNRQTAFPLDAKSYFESLELATAAAASAQEAGSSETTYYYGQTIAVVADSKATLYVIQPDKTLKEVGGNIAINENVFAKDEDGALNLLGFADAVAGAQAVKSSDGKISWVKPDTTTVEGLSTAVEKKKKTVGNENSGLVKQVAENKAAIDTLNGDKTVSGSVAVDQWNDLYSSFVQTLRDNGLRIEVKFTATSNNALPLTENSQIYKSVKESASQLGLNLTEEE